MAHQAPLSMGILQARILEFVAMPSSRVSSQPRDPTQVSCIAGGFFTVWATLSSVQSFSHVRLFVTPWTSARQASLSITSSRSPPYLSANISNHSLVLIWATWPLISTTAFLFSRLPYIFGFLVYQCACLIFPIANIYCSSMRYTALSSVPHIWAS